MNLTVMIIDGLLLLAMICVSLYGASILPAGTRVPIHFGPGSYNSWVPKKVGLVMWPAGGAVICVILAVTTKSASSSGGRPGPVIGLTIALVVMLITQIGALRVALTRGSSQ